MWSHNFSWKNILVFNFSFEVSISTQAVKFTFGHDKFGKSTGSSYSIEYSFRGNHVTKLIKLLANFTCQSVSLKFQLHMMPGNM